MEIVFNELSAGHIANSKEEANRWMYTFFDTAHQIEKRVYKKIAVRATCNLKNNLIAKDYFFVDWLHKIPDRDYLRRIVAMLTILPLLDKYPYYRFNGLDCEGLGVGHKENKMTISYPKHLWTPIINLIQESFDENHEVQELPCFVSNVSCKSDVFFHYPVRVFDHHRKHDNHRLNLNDGESTLLYNIPDDQKIVQKLLDCSFGESNRAGERLYNFDSNKGMYIEFNWHWKEFYHGYHITDENRVPEAAKRKIKEFQQL